MDSLKREKIASATVEMATELQKLKNERMQKEQEEKERLEKERPLLEKKFNALVKEKTAEIEMHLENARKEVEKAQAISDKSGVPFKSKIVIDFGRECYIPKSIEKLKEEFENEQNEQVKSKKKNDLELLEYELLGSGLTSYVGLSGSTAYDYYINKAE
jgi:hypothetical protein